VRLLRLEEPGFLRRRRLLEHAVGGGDVAEPVLIGHPRGEDPAGAEFAVIQVVRPELRRVRADQSWEAARDVVELAVTV
jgi:hypothetical protein